MNEKSQYLNSLINKRLSFALKRYGFESSSIIFFFFFLFSLLVYSSLFLILCTHGNISLNLANVTSFSKYTRRNVNNFNKPKCNNFARWVSLILLLSSVDFFLHCYLLMHK